MYDPYDTGTPKYSTAYSIYEALSELVQTEEMSILSEMFADVSYENQEYYYTFNGSRLMEQFEQISVYSRKLWLLDLAMWRIDQSEVHDLVYQALLDSDLAKRIGLKKLFVEHMLRGDTYKYKEIVEDYIEELSSLDRFDRWEMVKAWNTVMEAHGWPTTHYAYDSFCHSLCEKLRNLNLHKEIQLIAECRALLTSYDDFMMGLRANQHLYNGLEQQYQSRAQRLQACYDEKVRRLLEFAESQGVVLPSPDGIKVLLGAESESDNAPL